MFLPSGRMDQPISFSIQSTPVKVKASLFWFCVHHEIAQWTGPNQTLHAIRVQIPTWINQITYADTKHSNISWFQWTKKDFSHVSQWPDGNFCVIFDRNQLMLNCSHNRRSYIAYWLHDLTSFRYYTCCANCFVTNEKNDSCRKKWPKTAHLLWLFA